MLNDEDIYLKLLEKYPGLSLAQIADMNAYQKSVLLRGSRIKEFSGTDEFLAWQRSRGITN